MSGPPRLATWNRAYARESMSRIAGLAPRVVASGHDRPLHVPETAGPAES